MRSSGAKVAVVGHVEWTEFARVPRVPRAGEVVHASDSFEEPAGGGAVVAVALARLAGEATLFTALGDDEHGHRSMERLKELGVDVRASFRDAATRRAITLVNEHGERTITTFGGRLDPLGEELRAQWQELGEIDAVYFTAGDVAALRLARERARVLVASPRARHALGQGVGVNALVLSGEDEIERREAQRVDGEADVVVSTEGERGGCFHARSADCSEQSRRAANEQGRWESHALPGEVVDAYGCGDSFAAGLTYGLGVGLALDNALALGARCGATCLTGRGPYERQLSAADLSGDEN